MSETMNQSINEDEAQLRETIERWTRAFEAKDIDAMMADYVEDVLLFDCVPPFQVKGRQAMRKTWEQCLPHFPKKFRCEAFERQVHVSGDLGYMHQIHRIVTDEAEHPAAHSWLRITAIFRKIDGRWLGVHDHVSTPFDPMTGRAAFITDPTKPDGGITTQGPVCG